jgi:dihydroorotate dehydrogenase electron transfer subunit
MKEIDSRNKRPVHRGEFTAKICDQRHLGDRNNSLLLELSGDGASCFAAAGAGQFVQLACRDFSDPRQTVPLLRRPFSIAGVSAIYNELRPNATEIIQTNQGIFLEVIYRVLGPGTKWLMDRTTSEEINLLGPLGNGFSISDNIETKNILIGGGVGLPPLFFLADQLTKAGIKNNIAFAGARTKSHFEATAAMKEGEFDPLRPVMLLEQFNRSGTASVAATEDGSFGYAGSVVAALNKFLDTQPDWRDARIFACGPHGMLKEVAALAQRRTMACQVCMEAYMSCGIGLCQSCVVAVKSVSQEEKGTDRKYKMVCSNGPVFDAEKIIWE